ncbi:hypothetical protein K491DRAFT_783962 [Lophiostoma macrostomum CBS 122681]|uniref:Nucleoporin Pom152 n=1 Tax=Lophiostoma macrostomum CBS 122681 TaxID=1314788 RepID=A0A6A6SLW9_9PLEO|nr:hypothetical protein K491DRAFT_783962 [Lophiostoma macrostomum CBS 122681]
MNGTPRRGPGGFPATPQHPNRSPGARSPYNGTPGRQYGGSSLPQIPLATQQASAEPWIPAHIMDPPTQRSYAVAIYVFLWAYKLYDFYTLAVDETESFWYFIKWCFIDSTFLFCLPLFSIPWLEWSNLTSSTLAFLHVGLDAMLMFRIGVPVQAWLVSAVAFLWDSELAISERSVKPGPILHNASLILGKQIINILPEGSAILNPNRETFCLNSSVTHLELPILINQTEPIEIELTRIDIGTNHNETITIRKSEVKKLLRNARKAVRFVDPAEPLLLRYNVKKTGVYILKKVLDQSKLEVRPRSSNVVVATCPQARVKPTGQNRCRNDLSDVALEVEGIPPLRIKYRTTVGGRPREASEFQGLQPEDFVSPLSKHTSQALVRSNREDVSWARPQKVLVPLNETLINSGIWSYSVEEVADALGNIVSYVGFDEDYQPRHKEPASQSFTVHERPNAILDGCNPQHPLRVAKGFVTRLPIKYGSTGKYPADTPHTIEYLFTPEANLLANGNHSPQAELKKQNMKTSREQPQISASGLYTIKSVSTDFCGGEVLEPASCLLQNPPEPGLSITSEDIVDKCAGNPIGLRVELDLIGTPPFSIRYTRQSGRDKRVFGLEVKSLRSTTELTPPDAGHYTYTFNTIKDFVYGERPLHNLVLEQDVKPSASAHFIEASGPKQACIDDTAEFDVRLQGEGPWRLEYEVVHNGKREKRSRDVEEEHYTIQTEKLSQGGEYTVALTSITDKMGCKEFLKEEAKVNVRHERPKAYFGHIEGKQSVMALQGKPVDLPLRLTGAGPWRLEYENLDTKETKKVSVQSANDKLNTQAEGLYQLLRVRDSVCPGIIDEKASQFSVGWVPRPQIHVPESAYVDKYGEKFIRQAICEGEEDAFDVMLHGNSPFDVSYEQQFREKKNGKTAALKKNDLRGVGGMASVNAETSQAGTYEYKFVQLADNKYDHSSRHFTPVTIQQTVHSLPSARFNNPGKTYSFCHTQSSDDGEEVIPVTLDGVPPFYLEVEIKHHGTPKPELSVHRNIDSHKYDLKIEHRKLHLGHSAVSIRKVRDSRGCTKKSPPTTQRVQISVHDAPTATPLEDRTDFCVGERLSFALGGQFPFTVYYTFDKKERKASNAQTTFRRLAELPGTFTITGLRDSASECLAGLNITKQIHPIPSVRLSGGQVSEVDIHEGGGTDLDFQFWGTPPFEFTYTRSTNAHKGKKSKVLEIRTEVSYEHRLSIPVQEEGTYEVVSIKDRWCSFAKEGIEGLEGFGRGKSGRKMLQS